MEVSPVGYVPYAEPAVVGGREEPIATESDCGDRRLMAAEDREAASDTDPYTGPYTGPYMVSPEDGEAAPGFGVEASGCTVL